MIASLQSQAGYTNNTASAGDLATANSRLSGGYSTSKNFELAIMAGVGVSSGDAGLGFGGHVDGFYFSDPHLGFGGSIGYLDFSYSIVTSGEYLTQSLGIGNETITDNYGLGVFEIMPAIKYVLDGNGFKPYFVGGVGVAMISQSQSDTYDYLNGPSYYGQTNSTTNYPGSSGVFPMIQAGVGAEMKIGNDMNAFGEAKYSLLISSAGTGSYIPVEVGINFYP